MGVVDSRGNCPTNRGSCLIGVIVLRGRCPEGCLLLGGSSPRVIVLWGNCPMG